MKDSAVGRRPKAAAGEAGTQDVINRNTCTALCSAERLIHPVRVEERHQSKEAPVLTAIYPSLLTHPSKALGGGGRRGVGAFPPALLGTFTQIQCALVENET